MAETETFDPKAAAQKLLSMSGLEGLRYMMAGNHPPPSIAITLGFTLAEVDDGAVNVTEDLDLDVTRRQERALQKQCA
ncbi:MAG: hypothetical protein ABL932_22820, partial [Terricaulis sp.]